MKTRGLGTNVYNIQPVQRSSTSLTYMVDHDVGDQAKATTTTTGRQEEARRRVGFHLFVRQGFEAALRRRFQ